ncbi:MAG: PKD domain-containing protein [Chitinophagales bacterium]
MNDKSLFFFLICTLICSAFSSCQKAEKLCETCIPENKLPVANAGRDTIITLPQDNLLLDATASHDPDGSIDKYSWAKISGPSTSTIINSQSMQATLKNLANGIYQIQLTVTDNSNQSAKDTVMITVDSVHQANHAPIVNAGPDQIINLPTNTVTLDGNQSADPDNDITGFTWEKISGPQSFNIENTNSVQTQVTSLVEGVYQFELKINDAGGLTGRDTMQVTVNSESVTVLCGTRPVISARLTQIGSLSVGRNYIQSATAGNKILFGGGNSESGFAYTYSSRVDIYDYEKNTWTTAELTVPERQGMAVATVGNKILFAGGGDNDGYVRTSRVDIYDASDNSWTTAELSQPRIYLAAATLGNKVYFAGGWNTSSTDVVDIFDNATNSWSTAHLSEARYGLSATTAGNKIYFAGGVPDNNYVSQTIDVFDGVTNSWSTSSLREPKIGMASIASGNKIFWASGAKSFSPPTLSDLVEIRDLNTGVSSFTCMIPRSSPAAVIKDDNIVFFTGYGPEPTGTHFEIYNITTGTWSTAILNRSIQGASVISVNNTIYVTGGSAFSDLPPYHKEVWKLEF